MSRDWEGFLIESKKYMNHPDYWNEWDVAADWYPDGWTRADKRTASLRFWVGCPRAWLRFHWYVLRDAAFSFAGSVS